MELSELERAILSYYIAEEADKFAMVPRFWCNPELASIIEDKVRQAVRKFGMTRHPSCAPASRALFEQLLECGAFSTTTTGKLGGMMHQFQPEPYKRYLAQYADANPVVQSAQAGDADFWRSRFESLK